MSTEATIDFESLLKPIKGDFPAGKDIDSVTDSQIKDWRVEKDPANYGPNDPTRPKSVQAPKWTDIIRLCKEQLIQTSKYPMLAAYFTEALTRQYGFAGARDGLSLMRQIADQYMDQLYPKRPLEEPDDIDLRLKGISWLAASGLSGQFDLTLQEIPIIKYANAEERVDITITLADVKPSDNQTPKFSEAQFADLVSRVPATACSIILEDIKQCQVEMDKLLEVLANKTTSMLAGINLSPQKVKALASASLNLDTEQTKELTEIRSHDLDKLLKFLASNGPMLLTPSSLTVDTNQDPDSIVLNMSEERAKVLAAMKVPALTRCKKVLENAQNILTEKLAEKNGQPPTGKTTDDPTDGNGNPPTGHKGTGQTRDQLYAQLKQIAAQLEKLDAHSPVPLLILKAVELQSMKFPKLVELLNSEGRVLQFITPPENPTPENPPSS